MFLRFIKEDFPLKSLSRLPWSGWNLYRCCGRRDLAFTRQPSAPRNKLYKVRKKKKRACLTGKLRFSESVTQPSQQGHKKKKMPGNSDVLKIQQKKAPFSSEMQNCSNIWIRWMNPDFKKMCFNWFLPCQETLLYSGLVGGWVSNPSEKNLRSCQIGSSAPRVFKWKIFETTTWVDNEDL